MGDTILVTGATGFVGAHLVAALQAGGREVMSHSQRDGDIATVPLRYTGVAHVFHLAARTFVPGSWSDPAGYYATNVLGTVNVLEFCRREGASVTFVSSYVYGRPQRLPVDEDHPVEPYNPYSHTKILAESVVAFYARVFDVASAIVRPFNVYGPGQAAPFLVPEVIGQALDPGAERIVLGDLRPRRDYIYVSDLVALLIATMTRQSRGTYNAGSGQATSVAELVGAVLDVTGARKPVHSTGTVRPNEILDLVADVGRAERELGWRPQVSLLEGLERTVQWVRSERTARH